MLMIIFRILFHTVLILSSLFELFSHRTDSCLAMDPPSTSKKEQAPRVATRQSSRRIVKKTMGPDYVENFTTRPASTDEDYKSSSKLKQLLSAKMTPAEKAKATKKANREAEEARSAKHCAAFLAATLPPDVAARPAHDTAMRGPKCRMCCMCMKPFLDPLDELTCKFCHSKYHVKCQIIRFEALETIRKSGYICSDCVKCEGCRKTNKIYDKAAGRMLLCCRCALGYHEQCHNPPQNPSEISLAYICGKWMCGKCKDNDVPVADSFVEKSVPANETESNLIPMDTTSFNNLSTSAAQYDFVPSTVVVNGETEDSPRMHLSVQRDDSVEMVAVCEAVPGPSKHNGLTNGLANGFSAPENGFHALSSTELCSTFFPPTADTEDDSPSSPEAKAYRQKLALWSPTQCAEVFSQTYPELSELIIKHGLFGSSLIILSRAQFMDLFELKVGTALKMHYAISQWRRAFF